MGGHDNHHDQPKSAQTVDQPPTPAPFQFSLRSLFVLVTAVAIICAAYRFAGSYGATIMFVMCLLGFYATWGRAAPANRHAATVAFSCFLATSAISYLGRFLEITPPHSISNHVFPPIQQRGEDLTIGVALGTIVAAAYWIGLLLREATDSPTNRRTVCHSLWLGVVASGLTISAINAAMYFETYLNSELEAISVYIAISAPSFLLGLFVAPWLFSPTDAGDNADA